MNKLYLFDRRLFTDRSGIDYILSIFVNLYLCIQLFDVSRNALLLPGSVHSLMGLTRDVSLYGVLIFLLFKKQFKIHSYLYPLIVLVGLLPLVISIGAVIDGTKVVSIANVVQYMFLFLKPILFLFILYNLDYFYVFRKENLIKTFIGFLVFLVLFSFFIYFFFPSLIIHFNIANRIGLGNMSVQSGMYLCAYILCLYFFPFSKKLYNWFCILVLMAGILLSVCSTGILCMIFVTGIFLFDPNTRRRSLFLVSFATIFLILLVIRYYDLFKPFMDYFRGKAEDVIDLIINFGSDNKTQSSSFSAREMEIQNMLENNNQPIDYLFGHGYFSVNVPEEMVENGYYDLYFDCGLYGVFVLLLVYIKYGLKSIKLFFEKKNVLGICFLVAVALFMVTLAVTVLSTLLLSFIMLFYFIFIEKSSPMIESD